jgi:hypothetical protein
MWMLIFMISTISDRSPSEAHLEIQVGHTGPMNIPMTPAPTPERPQPEPEIQDPDPGQPEIPDPDRSAETDSPELGPEQD